MNEGQKTFAEIMREQTQFCKELIDKARELMDRSKKSDDVDESEQLITTADEMIKLAGTSNRKFEAKYATELDRLISVVDSGKKKGTPGIGGRSTAGGER